MCDQTEVSYLHDDVVWVKIGPIWWPGVVQDLEKDDEGKEILAGLKKKPIAVVKFFQEDNYEFVKNLDCIYHYNCRKKDEFIKKGLDKFRTGAPHMKKFPSDVTTAESLTNGDINIINDPKFAPEKKESYSEIFGSGKKKTKKAGDLTPRSRLGRPPVKVTPYRPITHQRFINKVLSGESDHRVKTLIQANPSADDNSSKNPYKCHICKFETSRVNVIVAHHRLSHSSKNSINWTGSDSPLVRKKPVYKSRKPKTKKLFDTSIEDLSDEDTPDKRKSVKSKSPKEKTKSSEKSKIDKKSSSPWKRTSKENQSQEASSSKKPRFTDVLLADWNEDFDEDKKEVDDSIEGVGSSHSKTEEEENKGGNTSSSQDFSDNSSSKNQTEKMSCFDFDEEEEGFIGMSNANTYGRKIPRVIPVKDKPELGMDLEIDELFQKKNDSESEVSKEEGQKQEKIKNKNDTTAAETGDLMEKNEEGLKPAATTRRRRSKASKEDEQKKNAENSLAMTRTRRSGAKKSYLNEVIEKIDDDDEGFKNEKTEKENVESTAEAPKSGSLKPETTSSSRRKQDFKNQTIDSEREELVYSDIVKNEQQKTKGGEGSEKKKGKHQNSRKDVKDDITAQIDSLLEETKPFQLPGSAEICGHKKTDKGEEMKSSTNANAISFDYVPSEQTGKKGGKPRTEVKSISKMFSDSIPNAETTLEDASQSGNADKHEEAASPEPNQSKTLKMSSVKLSRGGGGGGGGNVALKRGSIVLSTAPKATESAVKVMPVAKQVAQSKEGITVSGEKEEQSPETEISRLKNIKTIKVKPESIPSSLISGGKLKGQTIIHQKSGKYVIVTQPPQIGRQRVPPGKVQGRSKVVILTSPQGEQKIITTGGLPQSIFKVEGGKMVTAPDTEGSKEIISSASTSQSQSQPVIKMVPDGKGGIMKQLTVSPKKVLLGGTKVLVSRSGSTFSTGNSVQKIALSGAGGTAKSGDFRLIGNYKGSGKTVLIQGSSNVGGGVVLKSSSVMPRTVTKVIQNEQTIPALKKKPKILMRASGSQGEYLVQSASSTVESPTYVVKQKGADGKFSTQKIVQTEVFNQPKVSASGVGTKRFFLSSQGTNKKGESFLIATNDAVPSKVIRMRQKLKEADGAVTAKTPQKTVSKGSEIYAVAQNSLLLPSQTAAESETTQIVQVQEQSQQPVLQTQVIAMPGPVGADGNQTYVLVSVDENGVFQSVDNSVVAYDASTQPDQIFINSTSTGNVVLLNSQTTDEVAPVFSTSSQDILAEALANTNVLEGSINNEMDTVVPSILLPPSVPSSVVQETSITLQKPIMTPLEMPSSVAPDTSGLEPPPLPPTPTDVDVLMEESEISGAQVPLHGENVEKICTEETGETFVRPENFEEESVPPKNTSQFGEAQNPTENDENDEAFKHMTRDDFEQEEEPTSFQSMPLLSDEPDTSEDVQGSEPIADQQFDSQKHKSDPDQLSRMIREQEPPSSTINESGAEYSGSGELQKFVESGGETASDGRGPEPRKKDPEDTQEGEKGGDGDQQQQQQPLKEIPSVKENQSMPIIVDDSNANTSDLDSLYSDVMSQKRFQEETEVSSTTDEYSGKNVTH